MQKVSKQSLAMIALSILLAISIALTFTFAALQGSKKATGTITFSGEASVEWTLAEGADSQKYTLSSGNVTIKLTEADFTFNADGSATVTSAALSDLSKVTLTIKNTANANLNYKVSKVSVASGLKATIVETNKGTLNKSETETFTTTLEKLVTALKVTDASSATGLTFVINAEIGADVTIA